MSTITNTTYSGASASSTGSDGTSTSGTTTTSSTSSLGQADFLKLMTEQLKNQDPLKPMDNSAFLGQLAQFSTVQGIETLNTNFSTLSSSLTNDQMLKGAELVGHQVLVPSTSLAISADGSTTDGVVIAPSAGDITVEIKNDSGETVRKLSLTATGNGEVPFSWDGKDTSGNALPAGTYKATATHLTAAGASTSLNTYVNATVDSVTVGSSGLYVNLANLGSTPIDNVIRIGGTKS